MRDLLLQRGDAFHSSIAKSVLDAVVVQPLPTRQRLKETFHVRYSLLPCALAEIDADINWLDLQWLSQNCPVRS